MLYIHITSTQSTGILNPSLYDFTPDIVKTPEVVEIIKRKR